MATKKILTQKELEWYAEHIWDSEDGLGYDESDLESENSDIDLLDEVNIESIPVQFEDGITIGDIGNDIQRPLFEDGLEEGNSEEEENSDNETLAEISRRMKEQKKAERNITWKKKNLVIDDDVKYFRGNVQLPPEIMSLSTPYAFFKYLFTDELISTIVEQSNLFALQKDPNKPANITDTDLRRYLGVCLYMSVVHMPNLRSYWGRRLGFPQVREAMSEKKFDKVREFLHFNDNSKMTPKENPDHDKLYKIRPVIESMLYRFQSVPIECHGSVDEQICASKGRHSLKQYLPAKPHKWGIKLFVLAGVSGFVYNFEVYTGKGKGDHGVTNVEADIGITGNLVQRLCRIIPSNQNYIIYFDNFYTSLPLITILAQRGILSLGTVRRNRIPNNSKLPSEKEMNKRERGSCCEYVCTSDGVDISCVCWKDNKTVCLLSTYTGELPTTTLKRFDRKQKKKVDVNCPNIIFEYNRHMGGVDLMDSLIGRYKIKIRSKKWYIRLFYHLLDQTVVNSWLLYKRQKGQKGETDIMKLADFRIEIATCLSKIGSEITPKRGRPSDLEKKIQKKKHKSVTTAYVPPKDVRLDETGHWPLYDESRQRCKLPGCKSFSFIKCRKCGLHLCLNKNNNCFFRFHTS